MPAEHQPFEIHDHSGDLRILAHGRDEMEALANASCALLSQIVAPDDVRELELRTVIVENEREEDRIISFLNELIYLIDAEAWIPSRIKRLTSCGGSGCERIEAVLSGESLVSTRHTFKYEVKAVTYHEFKVMRSGGLVTIQFVCDL